MVLPMEAGGRRERKKQRTREAIAAAAFELFAERGFEGVTASEIAARADVARATLFSHFATKEAIVLEEVGDDDPAAIVRGRSADQAPLAALRAYYEGLARATAASEDLDSAGALRDRLRIITESPTLLNGVRRLGNAQQAALATALVDHGVPTLEADVAAAQICATLAVLKMRFFAALTAGDVREAAARLPAEVEVAFDLLENGVDRWS